jgi:acetoacetyl-CoA synthetase
MALQLEALNIDAATRPRSIPLQGARKLPLEDPPTHERIRYNARKKFPSEADRERNRLHRMRCSVGQYPSPTTIEVLAPIWERILKRTGVRADENFFDLGGDPSSATQLFGEIANISGRELSPVTIYQAPTIALLAALLAEPTLPRFPTLVPLRSGSGGTPIFATHGMGGSVMELYHFVKGIESERPIYGLQLNGFDGREEPLARVEDIAERYLIAMKEVQPHGPYALIGYSFGGLVMMEIGHRLRESGEKVALLAMVETFPHNDLLPWTQRLALHAERVKRHATIFASLPMRKKIGYVGSHSERLHASWNHGSHGTAPENGLLTGAALKHFSHAGQLALTRYRSRFYPGKINFVKAAKVSSSFPDDPRAIWQALAEEFEMDTVAGDHFGIVTTHGQELAAVLSRHLAAAFAEG